jgi:hypothetical protein
MAMVEVLPSRRLILVDERGDALRATWHPNEESVVLSEWKSDVCRATYRLKAHDIARVAQFLTGTLGAIATAASIEQEPARAASFLDRALAKLGLRRG